MLLDLRSCGVDLDSQEKQLSLVAQNQMCILLFKCWLLYIDTRGLGGGNWRACQIPDIGIHLLCPPSDVDWVN